MTAKILNNNQELFTRALNSAQLRSHPHHSQCDLLSTILPIIFLSTGIGAAAYKIYEWSEKVKRNAEHAKVMRSQGQLLTVYVYYLQIFTLVASFPGRCKHQ